MGEREKLDSGAIYRTTQYKQIIFGTCFGSNVSHLYFSLQEATYFTGVLGMG